MSLRAFSTVLVGNELPPRSQVITTEGIAVYAEASLDRNPLHIDDDYARTRGLDGIIGHGMFTMAHVATCVTEWAGAPGAIVHFKAKFRATVRPGDNIVAGGKVTSLDPETRTATLEVWVTVERDGVVEYPIKRSHARVRLA